MKYLVVIEKYRPDQEKGGSLGVDSVVGFASKRLRVQVEMSRLFSCYKRSIPNFLFTPFGVQSRGVRFFSSISYLPVCYFQFYFIQVVYTKF